MCVAQIYTDAIPIGKCVILYLSYLPSMLVSLCYNTTQPPAAESPETRRTGKTPRRSASIPPQ